METTSKTLNLVNLMSQFYQQIVQIKIWIDEGQLSTEVASFLALDTMPKAIDMANAVSLKLQQWINKVRQQNRQQLTDHQARLLDKACFAMTALADELFIMELDWSGQEHWQEVLLEQEFYQSCNAGVRFFDHLDDLINDRSHDVLEQQLAAVYLLVLRLGFSGRYRLQPERLAEYREKLFKMLKRNGKSADSFICIEAYQHRLVSHQEQRLAPLANWYRIMILGLLAYLVAGGGIWILLSW